MVCPKCLGETRVIDSRVSKTGDVRRVRWSSWVTKASNVFGWYSPDWRARKRLCKTCSHIGITLEIYVEDLKGAIDDAKEVSLKEQKKILTKLLKDQQKKMLTEMLEDGKKSA